MCRFYGGKDRVAGNRFCEAFAEIGKSMCNELMKYMLICECSCERFELEWNTKILRQLYNVSLNASSSYRPKYFVSPNFERSFLYSLCDTLEYSDAVKGSSRSFLRSAGCVFEFYTHILYIDRLARASDSFMLFN